MINQELWLKDSVVMGWNVSSCSPTEAYAYFRVRVVRLVGKKSCEVVFRGSDSQEFPDGWLRIVRRASLVHEVPDGYSSFDFLPKDCRAKQ